MDATPEELEAIQLRWTMLHPEAEPPNDQQAAQMLDEIRQREARIANEAVHRAERAIYPVQGRVVMSRSCAWALIWFVAIAMILVALTGIVQRFGWF